MRSHDSTGYRKCNHLPLRKSSRPGLESILPPAFFQTDYYFNFFDFPSLALRITDPFLIIARIYK